MMRTSDEGCEENSSRVRSIENSEDAVFTGHADSLAENSPQGGTVRSRDTS